MAHPLPLDQFAAPGGYEETLELELVGTLALSITIGSTAGLRRSTSFQNLKGKLSRFLSKPEKEETPNSDDLPRIKHSISHSTKLDRSGGKDSPEQVTRTLSDEPGSKSSRREKRRHRAKTDQAPDAKKTEQKEEASPSTRRRKTRRTVAEGEESKPRRKTTTGKHRSREKKDDLTDPPTSNSEPQVTQPEETKTDLPENGVNNDVEPRRRTRTVVLQPIGKSDKLFGIPLEEVLAKQKETHPDLKVPIFFVTAAKIVREKGALAISPRRPALT
jgi:hypothetical protein